MDYLIYIMHNQHLQLSNINFFTNQYLELEIKFTQFSAAWEVNGNTLTLNGRVLNHLRNTNSFTFKTE